MEIQKATPNSEPSHDYRPVSLNRMQMLIFQYLAANKLSALTFVASRGAGKSFSIAFLIYLIIKFMPRSSWAIQTATFQQALTRTLISTCEALELIGYRRDVTYWIGKRPPAKYALPFQAPQKFDRYLTFLNHDKKTLTGFHLFSQDISARGPSVDGIITDETLELDMEKFQREANLTNRGNDTFKMFTDNKIHHGIFHFTSMPTGENGDQIIKEAQYYEDDGYNIDLLKNNIIDLELEFLNEVEKGKQLQIYAAIANEKTKLLYYPNKSNDAKKKGRLYVEADVFDNIENVGIKYLFNNYESMLPEIFEVEMLNRKKSQIVNCFYAGYNKNVHGYKGSFDNNFLLGLEFDFEKLKKLNCEQDNDLMAGLPLDIGMDFGNINWLIATQKLQSINRFNVLKEFYVRTPKILDDVVKDFCDYYKPHNNKKVRLWPDAAGNVTLQAKTSSGAKNNVLHVFNLLKDGGFSPEVMNPNLKNWSHNDKFLLWNSSFARRKNVFPQIGFNTVNCPNLLKAMEQTPALDDGNNGIRKDKGSEKAFKNSLKRITATDSTDALDQVFFGNYKHLLPYAINNKSIYYASIFGQ